jgi:hypothetical protein
MTTSNWVELIIAAAFNGYFIGFAVATRLVHRACERQHQLRKESHRRSAIPTNQEDHHE